MRLHRTQSDNILAKYPNLAALEANTQANIDTFSHSIFGFDLTSTFDKLRERRGRELCVCCVFWCAQCCFLSQCFFQNFQFDLMLTCTIFQYGTTLAKLSVTSEHADPNNIRIRVKCCLILYKAWKNRSTPTPGSHCSTLLTHFSDKNSNEHTYAIHKCCDVAIPDKIYKIVNDERQHFVSGRG